MKILLALLLIGSFGCGMKFSGNPDYMNSVAAAMRGDSHYREREAARKRALQTNSPQAWAELEYWERKERERKEEKFRREVLDEMKRREQTEMLQQQNRSRGVDCNSSIIGSQVWTHCY